MPSYKGMEQAMTWLRSKANDRDSLDGINAELVMNVIADLKRQNEDKGMLIARLQDKKAKELPKDPGFLAWLDEELG